MNEKMKKLENPLRLAELDPPGTFRRIGLGINDVICDIGAGTGIFTIPAAKITGNKVYAIEIDDGMLQHIDENVKLEKLTNVELIKVQNNKIGIKDEEADLAIMVTVFHEIENKKDYLQEVRRLLRQEGRLAIIEFHKRETPMGPPVSHRIGKSEVEDIMRTAGFAIVDEFDLGDNFYCIIFKKADNE